MTSSTRAWRGRIVLLMLVCAALQAGSGSTLLASAATLALRATSHDHSVSVVAEAGHRHHVLSHEGEEHRHHEGEPRHADASVSERDHVLHVSGDEAASSGSRRVGIDAVPPLAFAVIVPAPAQPAWMPHPAPAPRARGSDLLRSVVLRL